MRTKYLEYINNIYTSKQIFFHNLWETGKKYYGSKEHIVYDSIFMNIRRKFTISNELNIIIR